MSPIDLGCALITKLSRRSYLMSSLALCAALLQPNAAIAQLAESEPNDTCESAQEIGELPVSSNVVGLIATNDIDFFRFEANPQDLLEIWISAEDDGQPDVVDPIAALLNSDCEVLQINDDLFPGFPRTDSIIQFTVPDDGVFVVAAGSCCDEALVGAGDSSGNYALSVRPALAPFDTISGVVIDADTGKPVPTLGPVVLEHCRNDQCVAINLTGTDDSGRFSFTGEGLPRAFSDTFRLVVSILGVYATATTAPFDVGLGESLDVGSIEVRRSGVFELSSLDGKNGYKVSGASPFDLLGESVSAAGDVNGDGIDDMIILAPRPGGLVQIPGAVYVVFGSEEEFASPFNVANLDGSNGFEIVGENHLEFLEGDVSAADVNGDGFDDVLIGAPFALAATEGSPGKYYVVFGSDKGFDSTLSLAGLDGNNGFVVETSSTLSLPLGSISSAGDLNKDGIEDIVIGVPGDSALSEFAGASYVIFGSKQRFNTPLALESLDGVSGFKLVGASEAEFAGTSVAGGGDFNADGIDDLLIGASVVDPSAASSVASYVVFGTDQGFSSTLELASLDGTNGFKLNGEAVSDLNSRSVAFVGDINGDGIDDLIIGASSASPSGENSGASYVLFGSRQAFNSSFELSQLDGVNGFSVFGELPGDFSGASVSSAGDVNADGIDDILIGAPNAIDNNAERSGASYVVFGNDQGFTTPIDLSSLDGLNGFKVSGEGAGNSFGWSVSAAGDINKDDIDDIVVGAPVASASYVIFGRSNIGRQSPSDGVVDITMAATPSAFSAPGDQLTITIQIANTSDRELIDVTVTDPLLGQPLCIMQSLWPGSVGVCTGVHYVNESDIAAGEVVFHASVSSEGMILPQTKSLVVSSEVVAERITVSAQSSPTDYANVGDQLSVVIKVTNLGDESLTNVMVSAPRLGTPLCNVGSLYPGIEAECTGIHFVSDADIDTGSVTFELTTTSDQTSDPIRSVLTVNGTTTSSAP